MTAVDPAALVRDFWQRMASNRFDTVQPLLADDFVLEWPQSRERIRGGDRFVRMNTEYPAHGPWCFTLNRLVSQPDTGEVVTDVDITDGVQRARALSFFTVRDGRIARLVEFWPDPYPAPAHRAHLVEPMDGPMAGA